MKRPSVVAVFVPFATMALAACAAPSEPRPRDAHLAALQGTPVSIVQNSADDSRSSYRVRYDVPPGVHALYFNSGVAGPVQGLRFAFAGREPVLRIRRIRDNCGVTDITFADATPHEATRFFDTSAITTQTSFFDITVENTSQQTVGLLVTARFDWSNTTPPCGL